ncbi:MAG: hypothetical protein ACRDDZ_04585 [Marinifilaceae bacterium]
MKRILLYLVCLFFATELVAQNNTGTPYSSFGMGLIPENSGPYTGMGGVTAAMRDNKNINFLNPASYTAMDSNRFYFQFAMTGEYVRLSTQKESTKYRVAQNSSLIMGFRLARNLYTTFGFTEISDIGYDVTYTEFIAGDQDNRLFTQHIQGEGGLNQLYLGLAWKKKNFSLGLNTGYVFGKIEKRQTLTPLMSDSYYINSSDRTQIRGVIMTPGIQYHIPLPKHSHLNLGGTFSFKTFLNSRKNYLAQEVNMSSGTSSILNDQKIDNGRIVYPLRYNVGFDYNYRRQWEVAGDYTYQKMSSYKEFDQYMDFNEYYKTAIGVGYTPNELGRRWGQRNKYMLGGYFVRSHLEFREEKINTYAITAGLHMPFIIRNRELNIGVAVDLGIRGTENQGLIQEKYGKIRLNFALKELWFKKQQIN